MTRSMDTVNNLQNYKNIFKENMLKLYGANGQTWLDNLPNITQAYAKLWNLSNLTPLETLTFNYILSGIYNRKEIILKIGYDSNALFKEQIALKALENHGAVKIIAYEGNALLLERLSPGISLQSYLPNRSKEALQIACDLTKKLHQANLPKKINLPSIEERFSLLDKNWPIPNDYLIKARGFRNNLIKSSSPRVVLHGDLHHDNILKNGKTWKAIDPHGVIGYPINEVWAFAANPEQDLPFIAQCFNFNLRDLQECYYAHAVLSSIWAIEDNMDPSFYLALTNKIKLT